MQRPEHHHRRTTTRIVLRSLTVLARATIGLVCLALVHPFSAASIDPASGRVRREHGTRRLR